ncbi:hypothetical protein BD779DRAFT_541825 [Infundibulicybe gibba]|nr:hypothetical protein BD779DRAFT_541825 [Infundibulicybe gibba]
MTGNTAGSRGLSAFLGPRAKDNGRGVERILTCWAHARLCSRLFMAFSRGVDFVSFLRTGRQSIVLYLDTQQWNRICNTNGDEIFTSPSQKHGILGVRYLSRKLRPFVRRALPQAERGSHKKGTVKLAATPPGEGSGTYTEDPSGRENVIILSTNAHIKPVYVVRGPVAIVSPGHHGSNEVATLETRRQSGVASLFDAVSIANTSPIHDSRVNISTGVCL